MARPLLAPPPTRLTRAALTRYAEDHGYDLVLFDPPAYFDRAIVGVVIGYGQTPAVLYDYDVVLAAMARDMGAEAAAEWIEFNTLGAYVGEATPRFLLTPEPRRR